jgi:hypothetical protein
LKDFLGQRSEKIGKSWKKLEKIGKNWKKLEKIGKRFSSMLAIVFSCGFFIEFLLILEGF